jgi:hypothetical protein
LNIIPVVAAAVLFAAPMHAAVLLIEDQAEAIEYIDRTFAVADCKLQHGDLLLQMKLDGVSPTEADMDQPMIGTDKIIRERQIMAALKSLFDQGQVCEDALDRRIAISKFGGCA